FLSVSLGAFGEIYVAEDTQSGNKCAIKFEDVGCRCPQLAAEHRFFVDLQNQSGFPRCIAFSTTNTHRYLAMDLLGKNLKELFEQCNKKFSVKTVLYIAIQTITRMETIHGK